LRSQGTLRLGFVDNAAPFSFADAGGNPQGYSVDLCRAVAEGIAAQLKIPPLKVDWVKLTPQNRLEAVRSGRVDIECSTTTWTLGRQQLVDFSLITFVDGGSVLVSAQGPLRRLSEFDGRRIAVITGTTTETALRDALNRSRITAELVPIRTRDEGLALLRDGKVDGLASDRTTLIGVAIAPGTTGGFRLLDEDFSLEQYALTLPRGDADLRLAVNRVLAGLYRSDDIRRLYDRWFGLLGPPSLLLSATYFIQRLAE
jgi:polar amino acid transport system substrate-binding protein/glutamate/aspartate transport system substrate-binding protein